MRTRGQRQLGLALGLLVATAVLSVLFDLPPNLVGGTRDFVLFELRLPRVLIGCMVGAVLGIAGAAFQALFQNPLATPSTLGTTAGATLFALLGLLLPPTRSYPVPILAAFAFSGALITTLFITAIAARARARLEEVLLAGVAISLAAGALSQALHLLADAHQLLAASQWSMGQLPQVGYDRVLWLGVPATLTCLSLTRRRKAIALMALGEDYATSLGVDVRRLRLEVLTLSCLGIGAGVALTGPIMFVGLVVPHLLRRGLRPSPSALMPLSAVFGGAFLVASDFLGRELAPGREIPVGVVTAGIGAPLLFFLVVAHSGPRRRGAAGGGNP